MKIDQTCQQLFDAKELRMLDDARSSNNLNTLGSNMNTSQNKFFQTPKFALGNLLKGVRESVRKDSLDSDKDSLYSSIMSLHRR